ncbi:unnamed protein product [Heterobilharzia americana]|nr:unnamed protein product [Heterobilharzia americana]
MNSMENDISKVKSFQESLKESLEEQEKLKSNLLLAKAESSRLKSRIESGKPKSKQSLNEEIEEMQIKKKVLIKKLISGQQRRSKEQEEILSVRANKEKIKSLIKAERENWLDERIRQLEECIEYSGNHWFIQYFPDANHEYELEEKKEESNELLSTENE